MGPGREEGGGGRAKRGGVPSGCGAGTKCALDAATEAGRGGCDASVTSEKLSRYLKQVYLAQMFGLL